MTVIPKEIAEIKRKLEHINADVETETSITDYNIMMGNLEDPNADEEESEEE